MRLTLLGLTLAAAAFGADPTARAAEPAGLAGRLIAHYHMQRVPQEGPWFSLTYASDDSVAGAALPARYAGHRHATGSAIVVVETIADFSAMHRLQSDEVWHFYGGSPLDMLLLYPDGHGRRITLGGDVLAGQLPQFTVPHGVWQGSAPHDGSVKAYSFCGDQLSPAFDYADFEMGYRDTLTAAFPAFAADISRLTRAEFARAPAAASTPPAAPTAAAPMRAAAFSAATLEVLHGAPGVDLEELVGRAAKEARTESVSVAEFTLAPGSSSGASFNHQGEEVFYVTAGRGAVRLADRLVAVTPRSTVYIPPGVVHSIEADADQTLVFLAITAPAFSPEDYVRVEP